MQQPTDKMLKSAMLLDEAISRHVLEVGGIDDSPKI
jgi:hypothetical protein